MASQSSKICLTRLLSELFTLHCMCLGVGNVLLNLQLYDVSISQEGLGLIKSCVKFYEMRMMYY